MHTRGLVKTFESAENRLLQIENQFHELKITDHTIKDATARLIRDRDSLETVALEIETHLSYFSFLEDLAQFVNSFNENNPTPLPLAPEFIPFLKRSDICINFLSKNQHFTDAALYVGRYRQCCTKLLLIAKNYIVDCFRQLELKVNQHLPTLLNQINRFQAETPCGFSDIVYHFVDTVQQSDLAKEFLRDCQNLKSIILQIEMRCVSVPEYRPFRSDCVAYYVQARKRFLKPLTEEILKCVTAQHENYVNTVSAYEKF
jgi:hypothetical protein